MLTRDIDSISVKLETSNDLRCEEELAYVKAYNIYYTHFDTLLNRIYPTFDKK